MGLCEAKDESDGVMKVQDIDSHREGLIRAQLQPRKERRDDR